MTADEELERLMRESERYRREAEWASRLYVMLVIAIFLGVFVLTPVMILWRGPR